jgi:DnaJ like chaperone protein
MMTVTSKHCNSSAKINNYRLNFWQFRKRKKDTLAHNCHNRGLQIQWFSSQIGPFIRIDGFNGTRRITTFLKLRIYVMGWLSGIIGGGLGAAVAGPFGAIIGAAIGAGIGKSSTQQHRGAALHQSQQRQAIFFTAAFSMVGKLAKADGRVCEDEIAAIEKISKEALGLDSQTRAYAVQVFTHAKDSHESFTDYARQFGDLFWQEQQLCNFMLSFLFQVAMADGSLHPQEEAMLLEAKTAFRLPENIYQSLYNRFVGSQSSTTSLKQHYQVLDIPETSTLAEVKKAYRSKAQEFHPDKIEGKGLPPEFIKFANDKLAEINAAYEAITAAQKHKEV